MLPMFITMSKKLTYIDLFCGAGGLSIGLANAGFELIYANDFNKESIQTFKHNLKMTHPHLNSDNIIEGDITELYKCLDTKRVYRKKIGYKTVTTDSEKNMKKKAADLDEKHFDLVKKVKTVDLLCGGPPCQGFSMIGKSKKSTVEERSKGFINDSRNYLFKYFLKFAESYRPKIILIENVKGIQSSSNFKDLIINNIKRLGYKAESYVFSSNDFGIPQLRNRIFFIGIRSDLDIHPNKIYFKLNKIIERVKSNSKVNLGDAIYDLPQIISNPNPNNYRSKNEIPFKNRNSFGMNVSSEKYSDIIDIKKSNSYIKKINTFKGKIMFPDFLYNHKSRYNNLRDKHIFKYLKEGLYLNHPDNFKALNGDGKIMKNGEEFKGIDYVKNYDENGNKIASSFSDKYFKLNSKDNSKTIIAHLETDGNSYVHPPIEKNKNNLKYARSITPREAARIQSFPDWYKFEGNLRNQFRQIGNAVPPLLAYEIGKELKNVLK